MSQRLDVNDAKTRSVERILGPWNWSRKNLSRDLKTVLSVMRLVTPVDHFSFPVRQVEVGDREKHRGMVVSCMRSADCIPRHDAPTDATLYPQPVARNSQRR